MKNNLGNLIAFLLSSLLLLVLISANENMGNHSYSLPYYILELSYFFSEGNVCQCVQDPQCPSGTSYFCESYGKCCEVGQQCYDTGCA